MKSFCTKKSSVFIFLIFVTKPLISHNTDYAVIAVPVADMLSSAVPPKENVLNVYQNLSFSPELSPCHRIHQLLYNDIVEIIKETEHEVQITTKNCFYLTKDNKKESTYWTLKTNVCALKDLRAYRLIKPHTIPCAVTYDQKNINQNVIILKEEFYDPETHLTFSPGTRFVTVNKQSPENSILVYVNDYHKKQSSLTSIPRAKCCVYQAHKTPDERIKEYVSLVREWAHHAQPIPYVWGGTSVIKAPHSHKTQKFGLDCSGMILRAASICYIPYFCKNSSTLSRALKQVTPHDTLENGDLIFFRGHVIVISDINNNLIVEARGYNQGYGIVHEIPLAEVFDDITTYQELKDAFHNKKPLRKKNKSGTIKDTLKEWSLLRIKSVFE